MGEALLVVLDLVRRGEDLRSVLEEAGLPLRERHGMDAVGAGDLAIGALMLEGFEDELELELRGVALAALGHGISSVFGKKISPRGRGSR